MKPKEELIRVVHTKDGVFSVDKTGKANGRGAYLCRNRNCLELAKKSRRLEKAFSGKIPDEIYDSLAAICKSE